MVLNKLRSIPFVRRFHTVAISYFSGVCVWAGGARKDFAATNAKLAEMFQAGPIASFRCLQDVRQTNHCHLHG